MLDPHELLRVARPGSRLFAGRRQTPSHDLVGLLRVVPYGPEIVGRALRGRNAQPYSGLRIDLSRLRPWPDEGRLQDLRHKADYDPQVVFQRSDAVDACDKAEAAAQALAAIDPVELTDILALLLVEPRA